MRMGNREPVSLSGRRRGAFSPASETLEVRRLLSAAVDLATTQSAPLGVEMIGQPTVRTNAGYTVTDVGDLTGSGFDDFVVAAPGNNAPTPGGTPTFTGKSTVYLVFGSKQVNVSSFTSVDFKALVAGQRGGDLGQLGTVGTPPATAQINPTVGQPAIGNPITGYNFDGLTLTTGTTANSGLGYSVAALGDINGDGRDDFALGAPNEAGGGKVYVIYGSAALVNIPNTSKSIDLDTAAGLAVLSGAGSKTIGIIGTGLTTSQGVAGAQGLQVGFSVAGLGNYLNPGTPGLTETVAADVGIGVPGLNGDAGAAFAISGTRLSTVQTGTNVDLSTLVTTGTNTGTYAIEYLGATAGDRAGASVSSGGNFDGATTPIAKHVVDDFLIGAPGLAGSAGKAYLVYSQQDFPMNAGTMNSVIGSAPKSLAQLTQRTDLTVSPNITPLQGLVFQGAPTSQMGFSVSAAGDFNGDGFGDIIIGAPSGAGSASIYYGQGPVTARYTGVYGTAAVPDPNSTTTLPALPLPLVFVGATGLSAAQPGDEAGYSVSYVGDIPGEGINGVLVGAPGSINNAGEAYIIPGNYASTGTPGTPNAAFPTQVTLASAITNPAYAILPLIITNANGTTPAYLGTSVSALPQFLTAQSETVDRDSIPDVFVGSPGFSFPAPNNNTAGRDQAGAGFALEGTFLPVATPNNVTVTAAGVNTNSMTGPFTLPLSAATTTFYIFSAAAGASGTPPAFDPATDLTSPVTLKINGVTITGVTLTPVNNVNFPGEVRFTLTQAQLSTLGLVVSTTPITITISGKTTGGLTFIARAQNVTVTGGSGSGGGGGSAGIASPTAASILASPIFTGIDAGLPNPPLTALSHLISYQALPVTIAYQQFQVQPGFLAREEVAVHPSKKGGVHQTPIHTVLNVAAIGHSENQYSKKFTLPNGVYSRSKYQKGKAITFTHKVQVIPRNEQTQTFQG